MQVLLALVLVVVFLSTVTLADWCQPTGSSKVSKSKLDRFRMPRQAPQNQNPRHRQPLSCQPPWAAMSLYDDAPAADSSAPAELVVPDYTAPVRARHLSLHACAVVANAQCRGWVGTTVTRPERALCVGGRRRWQWWRCCSHVHGVCPGADRQGACLGACTWLPRIPSTRLNCAD